MEDTLILAEIDKHILYNLECKKDAPNFCISEYKGDLENAKNLACEYWDSICKLHEDLAPSLVRLEHYYNGEIYVFCENSYIGELEGFCKCNNFLSIISIIAENSDIDGKFKNWHRYPIRAIDFYFNRKS